MDRCSNYKTIRKSLLKHPKITKSSPHIERNAPAKFKISSRSLVCIGVICFPKIFIKMIRGPTVITVRPVGKSGGINCCCCRCCTCLNLQFLKTEPGLLKIAELVLGSFCQSLALNYGLDYSGTIGPSYQSFLTAVSWCLMTSLLLLICYIFSEKSYGLIKQSLFETAFNTVACFSYVSSCSYLGYVVNIFLKPMYVVTPYFQAYPAMSAAYMVGGLVGIIHGYDAYKSYKYYKGFR